MKTIHQILFLFLFIALTAQAEVYKCQQPSGKTSYQTSPCPTGTAVQGVVNVKEMSPEEREETKARLKVWQDEQAANESAKLAAEKERKAELQQQESLELQRRSVAAQEQQVLNQQQQSQRGVGFAPHYYDPCYPNRRFPYQPYGPGNFPYPPQRPCPPNMPPVKPVDPLAPTPVPAKPGKFGMK